eukprot:5655384-Prymnesium_polylepis.1
MRRVGGLRLGIIPDMRLRGVPFPRPHPYRAHRRPPLRPEGHPRRDPVVPQRPCPGGACPR